MHINLNGNVLVWPASKLRNECNNQIGVQATPKFTQTTLATVGGDRFFCQDSLPALGWASSWDFQADMQSAACDYL
jgi:hypothetical protein